MEIIATNCSLTKQRRNNNNNYIMVFFYEILGIIESLLMHYRDCDELYLFYCPFPVINEEMWNSSAIVKIKSQSLLTRRTHCLLISCVAVVGLVVCWLWATRAVYNFIPEMYVGWPNYHHILVSQCIILW